MIDVYTLSKKSDVHLHAAKTRNCGFMRITYALHAVVVCAVKAAAICTFRIIEFTIL